MDHADWERIQEIFDEAIELPKSEQGSFIQRACAGDQELAQDVVSLINADALSNVIDDPIWAEHSVSNLVGEVLHDRYVIEEELPHGAMGEVYLAFDRRLEKRVVVKVLAKHLMADSYLRTKFAHEVEALSRIEDPKVVRIIDRNDLGDDRPYIVMEYIAGRTLRAEVTSEGLPLERVADLIKQIGDALDQVHAAGVLHRDLKPENIMLRGDVDSVVLIDFGIARILKPDRAATTTGQPVAGTLRYMAPEQLRGAQSTIQTDIYALGVIAYELVTGRQPFNPKSPLDLADLQRQGVKVRPTHLRDELSRAAEVELLKALSFDPKNRQRSAGEFGRNLAAALKTNSEPPSKWKRLLITSVILVALVASLLGVYKYQTINVEEPTTHQLTYFATVQRVRNGEQEKWNGKDENVLDSGDKLRLTVNGTELGYLYIFSEGSLATNDTNFLMLYPNARTNNGMANIAPGQTIESEWIPLLDPAGVENFWIVWSVEPVKELEVAKTEAFSHAKGGLTGPQLVSVRAILESMKQEAGGGVWHYKNSMTAVLRGKRGFLVTLAKFQYR